MVSVVVWHSWFPSRSFAHTENVRVPSAVGVPLNKPFMFSEIPNGGKPVPEPSVNEYGGCPPVGFVVSLIPPHGSLVLLRSGLQKE
jgi:hypothetical protein